MLSQCFKKTLKDYKITAKQLSDMTGISQNHLSEFRRGKSRISDELLWKLLLAMDEVQPGARKHFCSLMAGEPVDQKRIENIEYVIQYVAEALSEDDLPDLFSALAQRWKNPNSRVLQAH